MSTRGSRLEARNQRDAFAFEARVKSWEKRYVEDGGGSDGDVSQDRFATDDASV